MKKVSELKSDVLVIGGGIAGFFAAINARDHGLSVVLVDKGITGKSGFTPWANSFCFFDAALGDDREQWLKNVQHVTEYLVNQDYYNMFLDDSRARYDDMVRQGLFDASGDRHLLIPRILKKREVTLIERTMITNLVKQKNAVVGAIGFHMESNEVTFFHARVTILCSGAGAYKAPGYPTHAQTFDGDAMAYRVGASITGKEFVDFHTTGDKYPADVWKAWSDEYQKQIFATPGPGRFQIPFYQAVMHIHQEGPPPEIRGRMPPMEPKPGDPRGAALMPKPPEGNVVMGAATGLGVHKSEGVWPVNKKCYSGIPGLYAAGDALGSMLCGTVYPNIGTSLSGSAVQGYRAGESAAEYASKADLINVTESEIEPLRNEIMAPMQRKKGFDPRWASELLLAAMAPYYVLLIKEKRRLESALENISFLRDYIVPRLKAADQHELRLVHEAENMVLNAEMKLRASLMRTESRGSHYRADFPYRDDQKWLGWILIKKDNDGRMRLRKVSVTGKWKIDSDEPYEKRYPNRFPGEEEYLSSGDK